jgi:hypothetical protein
MLHPQGLAPRIVNLAEWRVHILNLLQQQMDSDGDAVSEALLMEVVGYPNSPTSDVSMWSTGPQRFATPIQIASPNGTMSFLSTTTVFGTANDITLAELALEMLFPEGQETIAIVKSLDGHRSQRALWGTPDPAISRDSFTIEEAASSGRCGQVLLADQF